MTVTPSPQGVVVRRADLEEVRDLLMERIHGSNARSPSHNARLAVEAMLAAAPAPSLAGGEVTNDDAPTYMRLAQALSRHPEVMVVERSDPTLELTRDSLEHLLDDVFPLAALSPEAPAREWSTDDMRELVTDEQVRWLVSATDVAHGRARLKDILNALTPRHEAPAEDEARRKLIQCIEQWDGETEYDADDLASLADGILHAFNGPPVVSPAAADELSSNPCQLEAPAEGAGGAMDAGFEAWLNERNLLPNGAWDWPSIVAMLNHHEDALRARSSAPEAREGEVAAWRKQVWVADGIGTGWMLSNEKPEPNHQPTEIEPLYTHPSAPSAEKLRIAVEAMQGAIEWDKRTGYRMPYRVRDPLYAAIDLSTPDALKAEG